MFNTEIRRDALAAAPTHGRDARPLVEGILHELFRDHASLRSLGWSQSIDHPSPEVFVTHDVVIEFTGGARFDADTASFHDGRTDGFDPDAYAAVASVVLTLTDLLVAAFGLPARVTVSRHGVEVTSHAL